MVLIWLAFIATGLLVFLMTALRRYERESAAAALEEVARLREQVAALTERVQNLEVIATEEPATTPLPEPPLPNENVSGTSPGSSPGRAHS